MTVGAPARSIDAASWRGAPPVVAVSGGGGAA